MSSAVSLLSADCLLGQILFRAAGHLENFPSCLSDTDTCRPICTHTFTYTVHSFFQRRLYFKMHQRKWYCLDYVRDEFKLRRLKTKKSPTKGPAWVQGQVRAYPYGGTFFMHVTILFFRNLRSRLQIELQQFVTLCKYNYSHLATCTKQFNLY